MVKSFSAIIDKNLGILNMDKDVRKVFTSERLVLFPSALRLNSY